jgi:hypothetical protein
VRLVDVPVVAWIDIDDAIIHANVYAGNGREVAVPAQARGRNRPSLPPANLHLHQSTRSANGDGGWNRGRKAAYLHRQGRAGQGGVSDQEAGAVVIPTLLVRLRVTVTRTGGQRC